jgi:hypothetical protein
VCRICDTYTKGKLEKLYDVYLAELLEEAELARYKSISDNVIKYYCAGHDVGGHGRDSCWTWDPIFARKVLAECTRNGHHDPCHDALEGLPGYSLPNSEDEESDEGTDND